MVRDSQPGELDGIPFGTKLVYQDGLVDVLQAVFAEARKAESVFDPFSRLFALSYFRATITLKY